MVMGTVTPTELLDRYWEQTLALDPLLGTMIGDDRFDDRWPDPGPEGRAERMAIHRQALKDVASIDRAGLDDDTLSALDIVRAAATRDLEATELRLDCLGAVSHFWGPGSILADVSSMQRADTPERYALYRTRLEGLPDYLDAVCEVAMDGVGAGIVAPTLVVDRSIGQTERLLAMNLEDSPALIPVSDETQKEELTAVLKDRVMPAFGRYLATLKRYRPSATATIGLCDLPNGDEIYASQVRGWTTLPLDPQEVHELGERELARINDARTELARTLGYDSPDEALAAHDASGRNRASSKDDLLRIAKEQVQRGWDMAPKFFGRLPDAPCEVRLVEEFREADMAMAFYMPATADGSRAGIYYVNGHAVEDQPLHILAPTSFHEAIPGHHFQISLEQERPGLHPMLRFGGYLAGAAFAEGWGLYSELLADEMGLYLNDFERLGMLSTDAFRAARLVVDTGIHALGWSRKRAVDVLLSSGAPPADCEIEVDRYITMPAQALAYKTGQLEIVRMRHDAEAAGMTTQQFHDRLMELGSLPLTSLRERMTV